MSKWITLTEEQRIALSRVLSQPDCKFELTPDQVKSLQKIVKKVKKK